MFKFNFINLLIMLIICMLTTTISFAYPNMTSNDKKLLAKFECENSIKSSITNKWSAKFTYYDNRTQVNGDFVTLEGIVKYRGYSDMSANTFKCLIEVTDESSRARVQVREIKSNLINNENLEPVYYKILRNNMNDKGSLSFSRIYN